MDQWEKLLCDMRDFRASGVLYSAEARIRALRRLKNAILAHEEAILSALKAISASAGLIPTLPRCLWCWRRSTTRRAI